MSIFWLWLEFGGAVFSEMFVGWFEVCVWCLESVFSEVFHGWFVKCLEAFRAYLGIGVMVLYTSKPANKTNVLFLCDVFLDA